MPRERVVESIRDFVKKYRPVRKVTDSHGSNVRFEPVEPTEDQLRMAHDVCRSIHAVVGHSDGSGHVLFFPLTASGRDYDFFRGVLSVLAPKARLVPLVTPKSSPNARIEPVPEAFIDRVRSHLDSSVTHVHVVDNVFQGGTLDRIHRALVQSNFSGRMTAAGKSYSDDVPLSPIRKISEALLSSVLNSVLAFHPDPLRIPGTERHEVITKLGWEKSVSGYHARNPSELRGHPERRKYLLLRRHIHDLGVAFAKSHLNDAL